jgi:AcrR family transcriptional regulator
MHPDRRIRRTRRMLYTALVDLCASTGFDAVTVADIAERAGVNRTTFYRHYRDKFTFVTTIVEQGLDTPVDALRMAYLARSHTGQVAALEAVFSRVEQHRRLYRALLAQRRSQWFTDWLLAYWRKAATRFLAKDSSRDPEDPRTDAAAALVAHAMVGGATGWWLEAAPSVPASVIAEWCGDFLRGGVPALLSSTSDPTGAVALTRYG